MNVMNGLDDVNPFADPAVLQASGGQRYSSNDGAPSALDDYNPFDHTLGPAATLPSSGSLGAARPLPGDVGGGVFGGSTGALPSGNGMTSGMGSGRGYGSFTNINTASTSSPSAQTPPPYSASGASYVGAGATTDDLKRRQAELDQKANELQRREEELQRQQLLQTQAGRREENWPPLPSWSPMKPCFYQDIGVEIPVEFQRIVTMAYRLWMYHVLVLLLNFFASLAYFVGDGYDGSGVFGLSVLFLILFTPCSFVCWFRPLYKAFRTDSSINFMIFFFVFGVQAVASCLQTIGLDYFGTVGFINSIRMLSGGNIGSGVVMILVAICFAVQATGDVILFIRVHRLYRTNSTASVQKAKEEFAAEVMKNKEAQNFAANAAMSAASSTLAP